jgi:hypothetical protein
MGWSERANMHNITRVFYFIFEHNEPRYVNETYTFTASVKSVDGTFSTSLRSTSGQFFYQPLPRKRRGVSNEPYCTVPTSGLSSSRLPAIIAFSTSAPAEVELDATASSEDSFQHQYPQSVACLKSELVDCTSAPISGPLPLLPVLPRIFVKPITYEFLTTKNEAFDARVRVIVEDVTGLRPIITINGRRFTARPVRADEVLSPFRYDLIAAVRLSPPDDLSVRVEVANPYGATTVADYSFEPIDAYGYWGFQLSGVKPVHYSHKPGGRTPLMPYAGVKATIEGLPVVGRDAPPPALSGAGTIVLQVGGELCPLPAVRTAEQCSPITLRDHNGDYTTFYVARQTVESIWFAPIDTDRRLPDPARLRGFFSARPGETVRVYPPRPGWAEGAPLPGAVATAGSPVVYVSGSLDDHKTVPASCLQLPDGSF